MPTIENWTEDPLSIIKNIFDNRKNNEWQQQVHEYFNAKLNDEEKYLEINSINNLPLHDLKPNSLVRFRGMIQDTFEHEYYLDTYEVTNVGNQSKMLMTSRFQDIVSPPEKYEINMNAKTSKTEMRQILYCVSVPGETPWVKNCWNSKCKKYKKSGDLPGTSTTPKKRSLEDDHTENMEITPDDKSSCKRIKSANTEKPPSKAVSFNKNHPIKSEDGPVCLVKVYDENSDYKVNQVMEFIGILSVDPALSSTYENFSKDHSDGDGPHSAVDGMEAEMFSETATHHPPASLVPRLHVISSRKLDHINPLLPAELTQEKILSTLQNVAPTMRTDLVALLTKVALGDELVAEYLLAHLMARVYTRKDVLAVGSFPINITGVPPESAYPKFLAKFLSELVTKLHYFPMNVENLNMTKFLPTKNYDTNRLDSGMLQLSEGTHLILDECAMKPGNLDANGVRHVQALERLVSGQSVDYDFKFHQMTFPTDINALILSEGKSLLSCDCQVPFRPSRMAPVNMEEYFSSIMGSLNDEILNRYRSFMEAARLLNHEVPPDLVKTIEEDFVEARRENCDNMTAADLHMHLILARLISISVGKPKLNIEIWESVKAMESQRKQRLPPPPPPSNHFNNVPTPVQNGF